MEGCYQGIKEVEDSQMCLNWSLGAREAAVVMMVAITMVEQQESMKIWFHWVSLDFVMPVKSADICWLMIKK